MTIQCDWTGECTGFKDYCDMCTRNFYADVDDFTTDCFEAYEDDTAD